VAVLPVDVLVVGGGPAGSAAARLLSSWGHRTRLFVAGPRRARPLPESLPPSCGKLLDLLGVRDALDRAPHVRSTGNTVWWGGSDARIEYFGGEASGWQLTSSTLEHVLVGAARDAGVEVQSRRAGIEDVEDRAGASFVIDCTGRGGLTARARGWRVYEPGKRTLAVIARWSAGAWRVPDPTHTLIESYADGWAWSVPEVSGDRHVAVMVDPRTSNLTAAGARDVYIGEIDKTSAIRRLLRDAVLQSEPLGWDASMYSAARYADDRVLLSGDAATFIDPLSSAGVKKALASGWLAAVAVHTALVQPAMRVPAFDFFAAREADIYTSFRRLTAQHLSAAAAGHSHPFWSDRSSLESNDADDQQAIAEAFERIRNAPEPRLRPASNVRLAARPAVSGREIVLERRLVSPSLPAGVRFINDVDVVALTPLLATRSIPDLYAAYQRQCGQVDLGAFLTALATAVARGLLVLDAAR
jgi:flavin-dependent dehydrogenase